MSAKFFYLYIILGAVFVMLLIYNLTVGPIQGNNAVYYDGLIALFLFYRGYRIYKTKQDQELM
jgi:hypothetical protein